MSLGYPGGTIPPFIILFPLNRFPSNPPIAPPIGPPTNIPVNPIRALNIGANPLLLSTPSAGRMSLVRLSEMLVTSSAIPLCTARATAADKALPCLLKSIAVLFVGISSLGLIPVPNSKFEIPAVAVAATLPIFSVSSIPLTTLCIERIASALVLAAFVLKSIASASA